MLLLDSDTTDGFLDKLASRAPTPGGGSASAVVGAVAAALCGMVGRLNDKKDGEPGPLHDTIAAADELLWRLKSLAGEDVEAFTGLMSTWKLSDAEPDNVAKKQTATILAAETPLTIMAKAYDVMKLARAGLEKSKKNCLSDAGVAAFVAQAALESARVNVMINLPGIKDEQTRAKLAKRAATLLADARALREEVDRLIDANYA
ncbi:MAG: cyclodeaminase/cyclohydrolase family protein [Planctomycetota bacterium]